MTRATTTGLLSVGLSVALLVAGCGGGSDSSAGDALSTAPVASDSVTPTPASSSPSVSTGSTSYLPAPSGVSLTAQGTDLRVGDTATVAWQPRQGLVGVLDVKIVKLQKASFKHDFVGWDIKASDRSTQPYFVRAQIENAGDTQLGGRDVPLYIVDGSSVLVEASSFASTFKPCPKGRFPDTFAPGDATTVCLVYLAPHAGQLTAVSFRPTEDFDPITWTGKITSTAVKKPKHHHGKGGKA